MRRQRNQKEEVVTDQLIKRLKDEIPENVVNVIEMEQAIGQLPDMIMNLSTGQFNKVAAYLIVTNELVVYHLYLILKDMENQWIQYDTDDIFRRYNIWNKKTRAMLYNDDHFNMLIASIRVSTGRTTYSPRWVFWSTIKLRPQQQFNNPYLDIYTFTFENRIDRNDIVIIEFMPRRKLLAIKKKIELPTFAPFLSINKPQATGFETIEIKIDSWAYNNLPIDFDPGWSLYTFEVIPYIYQMFANGYILRDFSNLQTNLTGGKKDTLMIAKKCTMCDKQATLKCRDTECEQLMFCSKSCHSSKINTSL